MVGRGYVPAEMGLDVFHFLAKTQRAQRVQLRESLRSWRLGERMEVGRGYNPAKLNMGAGLWL